MPPVCLQFARPIKPIYDSADKEQRRKNEVRTVLIEENSIELPKSKLVMHRLLVLFFLFQSKR